MTINFLIFCLGVIGMTNILIDGTIFGEGGLLPLRPWLKQKLPAKFYDLFECHQCMGTWCGFMLGFLVMSWNPLVIFACGCAGSCLADSHRLLCEFITNKMTFTIDTTGEIDFGGTAEAKHDA